jgi:RNA polymerase sigma factor (sigma-70 family)
MKGRWVERGEVDLPSDATADVGTDAAPSPGTPAHASLPDFLLAAAVDDAVIGDVLAGLPEAQPERTLRSATDFSSLYIRHRSGLAAHARRYLRDPRDVDEVVQETFLRLFLAISEIETELQAIAFARRTLTNLCIDRYRADRRRPTLITLDANPYFDLTGAEEEPDPVLQAEDAAIVRDALARLSPLHRAALVKREIEEKALPQIAAELGVAEESVKHLLFRARRALRRLLVGTSVEPGVDLAGADGIPGQPNPLVRGMTVFIFFLVGALAVAAGIRPLFSGGGHARIANDAVGASGLDLGGPDGLAPKGAPSRPKPATHHHRRSGTAVSSSSSDTSPTIRINQPKPVKPHPTHHAPVTHAPRSHFTLRGPLRVTGTPSVTPGGVSNDGNGNTLAASSFNAPTDHGTFALNQSVSTLSSGATSVDVTPSFLVRGAVQAPELAGSTAAVGTDPAGNITVDVTAVTQPDSAPNAFPLRAVSARFVLTPDLTQVLSETVTLSTRQAAGMAPVSAGGSRAPAPGSGPPSSGPGKPGNGSTGPTPTPAPPSGTGTTTGIAPSCPADPTAPPGPPTSAAAGTETTGCQPAHTAGGDKIGQPDPTGVSNKPA